MEFRSLENIDFDTLFNSFKRAFSDYDIHFDKEEVRSMLKRRGYNPRLSFAAFDHGEIVAFTLNGVGVFNDILTAYDTGTGTLTEYRGQGLAGKIFNYALPHLKEAGIRQYLLEVLQNNNKAIAVYRRMNFEITREFDCFRQKTDNICIQENLETDYKIKPVDISFIRQAQPFCDFTPSWQNSLDSIERAKADLSCLGVRFDEIPVGYCVFDPHTGDLTQIAVRNEFRRKGIATMLLHEAIKRMKTDFIKVLNINSDNKTLSPFLRSKNIALASKQYEMVLQLSDG